MKVGDILFVNGGTVFSSVICLFTHSEFSHVAQVIGFAPNGKAIIAEDLYNGSIIRSFSYKKGSFKVMSWKKPLTSNEKKKLAQYHYDTAGTFYAYHQLFIIAFYLLFGISRKRNKKFSRKDLSICSEKIHETSIFIGRDLRPDLCTNLVTPHDLYESRHLLKADKLLKFE